MLGLQLREEFRGRRLKGTTVDFKNRSGTGALDVAAADFLNITYPSHDLLRTIEATQQGESRPVVLLGSRGQGKSHLMAALYHLCQDVDAGKAWPREWSDHLKNPKIADLKLRGFWLFVERLATGRRLIITSDHGYAACGLFPDLVDRDQVNHMKKLFKSGRRKWKVPEATRRRIMGACRCSKSSSRSSSCQNRILRQWNMKS